LLPANFVYFASNSHYNNGMAKNVDNKSFGNSSSKLAYAANLWAAADHICP